MKSNRIYNEPCLTTLKSMENASLDCVITSPPYWQLRDYGYKGQWGLEPTFQQYLEHLWKMMDLIYLKLKEGGTVWINLGDTYNGSKVGNTSNKGYKENTKIDTFQKEKDRNIKDKCLLLIPHRFAIGCIDRGWIVRNDIIWAKPNAMPESVTDRFSKKHEYFFFMVKSEDYYFDLDSIRDKNKTIGAWSQNNKKDSPYVGNNPRRTKTKQEIATKREGSYADPLHKMAYNESGKNPGSVSDFWDIPTKPSSEKHYASYNDSLLVKPVTAGCPKGGIVYDPFMGTGSTAEVALRLDRKFIGSEMSIEYCKIANKRIKPFLMQTTLLTF